MKNLHMSKKSSYFAVSFVNLDKENHKINTK